MPRPANRPVILKIEPLLGGKEPDVVCEFTGEVTQGKAIARPKIDDAEAWQDERNRAKAEDMRRLGDWVAQAINARRERR